MRVYKRYILINSVNSYLFYFFIFAPLYASQHNITLSEAGWIFSFVYGIQAILSYTVGRIFERFSPNWGVILARGIYGLAPLILFLTSNPFWFTVAMLLASFFDVFSPSIVLFERAIFPKEKREIIYKCITVISEVVKLTIILPIILLNLKISKVLFLTQFLLSIFYVTAFFLFMPKVESGSIVDYESKKTVEDVDKKNLLVIYLIQLLILMAFNFASAMIRSYYISEVLHQGSKMLLTAEVFYSASIAAGFLIIFRKKFKLKTSLILGSLLLTIYFFVIAYPTVEAYYLAHVIVGVGFLMWFPAKESIKFKSAPKELGRWEGFFQGANIFTRIVFPPIAAHMTEVLSYTSVYVTAGIMSLTAVILGAFVKD